MFTAGEGAVSSYSKKLNTNNQTSTETDLVGADIYLPEMLWALYFIQSQGYNVETTELYQDNKSTEVLEREENKAHQSKVFLYQGQN
jgi:hypothetical protein